MSLQSLWAKSYPENPTRCHPLWCHLLDVAAVCRALVPRFGRIAEVPDDWLPYLAALHDIGKADARFQGKAPKLVEPGIPVDSEGESQGFRHEARSAEWIMMHLQAAPFRWDKEAARVAAQATRGHHGDFQADAYNEAEKPWADFYRAARRDLAALVAETLKMQPHQQMRFPDASAAGMKLSGLIVLSDWIASNPDVFEYPKLYAPQDLGKAPEAYWKEAQEEARRAVEGLKLDGPGERRAPVTQTFAEVWPKIGNSLRPAQTALEAAVLSGEARPGLAIIEAPMGEGKTEAAIYLAACWSRPGVYIALPTQATSNQMHGRYKKFLEIKAPRRPRPAPGTRHGLAARTTKRVGANRADLGRGQRR